MTWRELQEYISRLRGHELDELVVVDIVSKFGNYPANHYRYEVADLTFKPLELVVNGL